MDCTCCSSSEWPFSNGNEKKLKCIVLETIDPNKKSEYCFFMDNNDIIAKLVDIIISEVRPLKIYLFGSHARGQTQANSDIDLLVVVKNGTHRRNTARQLYRATATVGKATDMVVVTESDLSDFATYPGYVISTALQEGTEIYAAQG